MKKGFERIFRDYPHLWNINNFAKFSCFDGDFTTFAKLNEKIDGKPILAAFWVLGKNYNWCVSKIPASNSSHSRCSQWRGRISQGSKPYGKLEPS